MCARHDVEVGKYLVEVVPTTTDLPDQILIYLTVVEMEQGAHEWQGCLRIQIASETTAEIYGGRPYPAQLAIPGVDS